jgi:hypothetical protein
MLVANVEVDQLGGKVEVGFALIVIKVASLGALDG